METRSTPTDRRGRPRSPGLLPGLRPCLFLDFDGTLLDLGPAPGAVRVPRGLPALLARAAAAVDGALAVVSGRSLADLDALLSPLVLPAAGLHGLERRDSQGGRHRPELDALRLAAPRLALQRLVALHPGLLLEDKGAGLAVHYRNLPGAEAWLPAELERTVAPLRPDFAVRAGHHVFELRAVAYDKAHAVDAYMREPPFRGRMPLFIGDDLTDRDGFRAAEHHGGMAIAVGTAVEAPYRLRDPRAVRAWLARLADRHGERA